MNKDCPICGKSFETRKNDQRTYCSLQCQIEWQKQYPKTGKDHHSYKHDMEHTVICDWCGISFEAGAYQVSHGKRFCSNDCRRDWFAKDWSQREEWKQNRREWAVNLMENTFMNNPMTSPQIIVNNILNDLKIKFINEKGYKNVSVDNYLIDYNLIIEVMGTYWHCDHRKYETIPYDMQVTRIKMDKIKHSYIKNIEDIEILYLWEKDLCDNYELCYNLVKEYIDKNGKLNNYNSFNYKIINGNILNANTVKPYMDWDIDDLNKIIDISVKEKISKKQQDKWTIFNCEYCEKEKEELTSHYILHKHHFCCMECCAKSRKNNKNWRKKDATPSKKNNDQKSLND
jgi:ribosomal protein L28